MRPDVLTIKEEAALAAESLEEPRLRVVTAQDFLSMEFPPREMVLDPVLPVQGLAMIYSKRGVGKTYCALGMGYAVAAGGQFLRWEAPKPRKVLLIDGEMPAGTMRDRLAAIIAGSDAQGPPSPDFLKILTPDLQEFTMPSLSSVEGQLAIDAELEGVEFVILDNVSTLCSGGKENEAESWLPLQRWALSLRRRGISVLFIHHAGKGGAQRGTSRREDILDTVLALKHPIDYDPSEGARFEVHIEKGRSIHGEAADPFEVRMETPNFGAIWTMKDIKSTRKERIIELLGIGMSVRDVAEEIGVSKSQVHRIKKSELGGANAE